MASEREVVLKLKLQAAQAGGSKGLKDVSEQAKRLSNDVTNAETSMRRFGGVADRSATGLGRLATGMSRATTEIDKQKQAVDRLAMAHQKMAASTPGMRGQHIGAAPMVAGGAAAGGGGGLKENLAYSAGILAIVGHLATSATRMVDAATQMGDASQRTVGVLKNLPLGLGQFATELEKVTKRLNGLAGQEQEISSARGIRLAQLEADIGSNQRASEFGRDQRARSSEFGTQIDRQFEIAEQRKRMGGWRQGFIGDEQFGGVNQKLFEAQIETGVGRRGLSRARWHQEGLESGLASASAQRFQLEQAIASSRPGNALEQQEQNVMLAKALRAEEEARKRVAENLQVIKQNELSLIQKEKALRDAQLEVAKKQADVLKEQVEKQKQIVDELGKATLASKQQFGMMSGLDKLAAMQIAEKAKAQGLGSLNKQELELFGRVDALKPLRDQLAAQSADAGGFQQIQQLTGADQRMAEEQRKLEGLERQKATVNAQIVNQIEIDEKVLADMVVARMQPLVKRMEVIARQIAAQAESQAQLDQWRQRVNEKISGN